MRPAFIAIVILRDNRGLRVVRREEVARLELDSAQDGIIRTARVTVQ